MRVRRFLVACTIASSVVSGIGSELDILQTFASLAGAAPTDRALDGYESLAGTERYRPSPRHALSTTRAPAARPKRVRRDAFKLTSSCPSPIRFAASSDPANPQLYNLDQDRRRSSISPPNGPSVERPAWVADEHLKTVVPVKNQSRRAHRPRPSSVSTRRAAIAWLSAACCREWLQPWRAGVSTPESVDRSARRSPEELGGSAAARRAPNSATPAPGLAPSGMSGFQWRILDGCMSRHAGRLPFICFRLDLMDPTPVTNSSSSIRARDQLRDDCERKPDPREFPGAAGHARARLDRVHSACAPVSLDDFSRVSYVPGANGGIPVVRQAPSRNGHTPVVHIAFEDALRTPNGRETASV